MALPSRSDVLQLGLSFRGVPFADVDSKALGTDGIGLSFRGAPFFGLVDAVGSDATASGSPASIALTPAEGTATGSRAIPLFEVEIQRKKWYLRRKNRILVFLTAQDADAYIEAEILAEKAIEEAKKTSRRARKRLKERVYKTSGVYPVESVDVDALGKLASRYAMAVDLPELIVQQDYERILQIQALAMIMQDEEDVELLLLA